jgi:multiple sugar transport system ATP-binding protein
MNMLEATVERANGSFVLDVGKQRLGLDDATLATHPALRSFEGRTVILGIRPEDLEDALLEPDTPGDRRLRGVVELREALGSELIVHFTVDGTQLALTEDVKELARDADVAVMPDPTEGSAVLVGRFSVRSEIEERKPVEVAVDVLSLHFFDPETSQGIYDGTGS